jgi:hypothetical protein
MTADNKPVDEELFGYLGTDEELATKPRRKDFERNVLGGCVIFSLAATFQLASVAIPLLIERDLHTYGQLYGVLATFLVAGAIGGIAFSVFAGLAGLCGSLAGLVPAATFLWLRITDKVSGAVGIQGMEPAEYPASYAWIIPAVSCSALAVVCVAVYWLRELLSKKSDS